METDHTLRDQAECGQLASLLPRLGTYLDSFLEFEHPDAVLKESAWKEILGGEVPDVGVGIDQVLQEIGTQLIPNGSVIPKPGCTSFITTGATTAAALAGLSSAIASPQRFGLTAFNYLEEVSLRWLREMFKLPLEMKGIYSSGGSVANLVALGAARQRAFENIGIDPSADGITRPCRIYASEASHKTIHRSAAVLGMGRNAVVAVASDHLGRIQVDALKRQLDEDSKLDVIPVAIVATAGMTGTGAIDPLDLIGAVAKSHGIWFHVDGAYGLPGILDPSKAAHFKGLPLADSVTVDPHKWMGAPVGIGATFVNDYSLLERAFTQGAADYFEGSFVDGNSDSKIGAVENSMEVMGVPYSDLGVELSAPPRGVMAWAAIREIGVQGMRQRICRHNAMAQQIAKRCHGNSQLEVLAEPTLSICCFRYVDKSIGDLNTFNRAIHRQLVRNSNNIPSTIEINGQLAIRPCFVGARSLFCHADALVDEVLEIGDAMLAEQTTISANS